VAFLELFSKVKGILINKLLNSSFLAGFTPQRHPVAAEMRLLSTSTLQLKEFYDAQIPAYAILSHRWETEVVTFQDLRGGAYHGMAGFPQDPRMLSSGRTGWISMGVDRFLLHRQDKQL
jgi:hypothetical protein